MRCRNGVVARVVGLGLLGSLALLGSCRAEPTGIVLPSGPCADASPPSGCGNTCTATKPCPAGLFCGASGTCTAQCLTAAECNPGKTCDRDGRCVDRSGGDGGPDYGPLDGFVRDSPDCPSVLVTLTPTTPIVELLIDRSSSMSSAIGGSDATVRWTAVKNALTDPAGGVVKKLEQRVIFGATLYSAIRSNSPPPLSEAPCPRVISTPETKLGNFSQTNDLLTNNNPAGGTPTEASIRHVTGAFLPAPDASSPRVLLLATDGDPDTCDATDTTPAIKSGVEDAVADAYKQGIQTFVLSVGSGVAEEHLQRIANEGVGQDRQSGTATVFKAATSGQLEQAFDAIIGGVRDCKLVLDGKLDPSRAADGDVRMNGQPLLFGTDWQVVDQTTIELLGGACFGFLSQGSVTLSAQFPCGAVIK